MMAPKSSHLRSISFISDQPYALETTFKRFLARKREKKKTNGMETIFNEEFQPDYDFDYDLIGLLVSKPQLTNVATHVQYSILLETGAQTQKITLLCDKKQEDMPLLHKMQDPIGRIVLVRSVTALEDGYFWRDCRNDGLPEVITFEFTDLADMQTKLQPFLNVSDCQVIFVYINLFIKADFKTKLVFDQKYSRIQDSKMFPDGEEEETKMMRFSTKILEVRNHLDFCLSNPMKARLQEDTNKWTERVLVS